MAKRYHLEMVENSSTFGKILKIALAGAAVYYGYKYLRKDDEKYEEFDADKAETAESKVEGDESDVGSAGKQAEDFATRVLNAARKIPDTLAGK